jgi:hypothetical protein
MVSAFGKSMFHILVFEISPVGSRLGGRVKGDIVG